MLTKNANCKRNFSIRLKEQSTPLKEVMLEPHAADVLMKQITLLVQ